MQPLFSREAQTYFHALGEANKSFKGLFLLLEETASDPTVMYDPINKRCFMSVALIVKKYKYTAVSIISMLAKIKVNFFKLKFHNDSIHNGQHFCCLLTSF